MGLMEGDCQPKSLYTKGQLIPGLLDKFDSLLQECVFREYFIFYTGREKKARHFFYE
jgi:hypothetical protein